MTALNLDGTPLIDHPDVTPEELAAGRAAVLAERAALDAALAQQEAKAQSEDTARQSLTDAVQLAALSPYPTPEEQAIIDAQVSASLALFRALSDPPADVTALAAAVLTLEVAR